MTESKLVDMPAHISHVPRGEPFDLSPNSIIIKDSGSEYLVGEDAHREKPDSVRQFGGSLQSPQYRRLLKALVAQLLGEGDHSHRTILSSPHHMIDRFRAQKGSFSFSPDSRAILTEILGDIEFRTGRSDAPWKRCRVKFDDEPLVFFEYQAVFETLPETVKSVLIWQIGYGDWQQTLVIDRRPMKDASARIEGLSGAVKLFSKDLGLAFGDGAVAWQSEIIPDKAQVNGLNGATKSCVEQKEDALRHWIGAALGDLLPIIEQWRTRFSACVISGGLCKDETFWRILQEETEGQSFKIFRIHEMPSDYANDLMSDPSMTAVQGLLKRGSLALDPGNGRLKGGVSL